jgi:hypothetical protein
MGEMVLRFLIGGVLVSAFAVLAEMFRPKSFAGLFNAAPSIALATIGITLGLHGREYAATETRSMILGAVGFLCYATSASWLMMRLQRGVLVTTLVLLPLWFGASVALWWMLERSPL